MYISYTSPQYPAAFLAISLITSTSWMLALQSVLDKKVVAAKVILANLSSIYWGVQYPRSIERFCRAYMLRGI
jgi:hypothetical protein